MSSIIHLDGKHQINLRSLLLFPAFYSFTYFPALSGCRYSDIPAILAVELIHQSLEHNPVSRGIFQSRITDDVMYHLVEQDTLCLFVGHIIISRHGELEIVELGASPSGGPLIGKLPQPSLGMSKSEFRNRQFSPEIFLVETPEPLLHPFYCNNHVCIFIQ